MNIREKEQAEGWGWISAIGCVGIGWGIVAGLGQSINPALLLAPLGLGIWKVVKK